MIQIASHGIYFPRKKVQVSTGGGPGPVPDAPTISTQGMIVSAEANPQVQTTAQGPTMTVTAGAPQMIVSATAAPQADTTAESDKPPTPSACSCP